ncbi:hypothetical protein [Cellulomonas shaoxiangyii]|uniref:PH domain-containing protein n=1 Tax=Cellulomonas shaoxiangyii TaxID=2566013 RepID=A0A4P7SEC1_9CELL|nr:hypothetical protein [Cellulomonas shaoxiangyii]QCB92479.1 hypothetical protein E5225_01825 [Cellulomonas shaoxiangyii]TGY84969.1 hypothetical protein E5226_08825 [Cellulomonas shaoxiangyii]
MRWAGHDPRNPLAGRGDDDLRRVRLPLGTVPQLAAFVADGRRPAGTGLLWLLTLTNVLLGAALAAGAAAALAAGEGAGWAAGVVAGTAWVGVGVGFGVLHLRRTPPADGARVEVARVQGWPAVVLRLDGTLPRYHAVGATGVAVALVAVATAAGRSGGALLLWLLALPVAACVPDLWVRVRRGGRLVLTREGVHLHGPDGAGSLVWDDVARVRLADTGRHVELVVEGHPDAPSWTWRRRRGLFPRAPRTPRLAVPLPLLDVRPSALLRSLDRWARDPGARAELDDDRGRRRLVEDGPYDPW